jgi:flagellar protein FliS
MKRSTALDQYRDINVQTGVSGANPHRLIAMLFEGALDRISAAKGALARGDIAAKGELISKAIAIVDGLRASLDHSSGEALVGNLASLYDYMEIRLVQANAASDLALLSEVQALLSELKSGWDEIPLEYQRSA